MPQAACFQRARRHNPRVTGDPGECSVPAVRAELFIDVFHWLEALSA